MIIGIGTDLTNIQRIQRILDRYGDRFKERIFSEGEQKKAESRRNEAETYAKRWAAKEACSKALGTGLRMGIAWRDMTVTNLKSGQPIMTVSGWAQDRLDSITPVGHIPKIHVSLTDDYPWAQAFIVIESTAKTLD